METFSQKFLLHALFLFHCGILSYGLANTEARHDLKRDQSSLLFLKSHIKDPQNVLQNNWTSGTPVCDWVGVTCDSYQNRVVELDISDMGLAGDIPPEINNLSVLAYLYMYRNNFSGSIPRSIFNMSSLQAIDLGGNNLSGSLPNDLCRYRNLRKLEVLDLSSNNLYGELPSSLGQCSQLSRIRLDDNNLGGYVPREIGNITLLEHLNLPFNNFNDVLKEFAAKKSVKLGKLLRERGPLKRSSNPQLACVKCPRQPSDSNVCAYYVARFMKDIKDNMLRDTPHQLKDMFCEAPYTRLDLDEIREEWTTVVHEYIISNAEDGTIPREIGNVTALRELYLNKNSLTGRIPEEIYFLQYLEVLVIDYNNLTGPLSPMIFNISSLFIMRLSHNKLSGVLAVLPKVTEPQCDIRNALDRNKPTCRVHGNLHFDISSNLFEGPIPQGIGNLTALDTLDLSENRFSGVIPSTLASINSLKNLLLYSNNLIGEIPPSICELTSLEYLHLSNNNLGGQVPMCVGNMSRSLVVLNLKGNRFHGLIPPTSTQGCALQSLNLNNNNFQGTLPPSIVDCGRLQILDIGRNQIQGMFPFWMETLSQLRVLVLKSNRFHGSMISPPKSAEDPFPMLQVLDISHNTFAGSMPDRYIMNFRGMMDVRLNSTKDINLSHYMETMEFVFKGLEYTLVRILTTFITVDMSSNKFSGSIPESIGKLNSLKYLNLSHNALTAHIPSSIGNVNELESLDLSSNQLEGEVPWQLTRLNFLSVLNLSMNNLVGQIPQSSGQFPTFENSSYLGNSGLCGFPLTKQCESENEPTLPQQGDDDVPNFLDGFTWQAVVLGYGYGFLIGVIVGYIILRCGRPKWLLDLFFGVQYKTKRNHKRTR